MRRFGFSRAALAVLGASVAWVGCSGSNATTAPPSDDGGTTVEAGGGADVDGDSGSLDGRDATTDDVPITYGECSEFSKCGGDIRGEWTVSGGCVRQDAFDAAKAGCPGFTESDVSIFANGTLVATSTVVERTLTVKFSATFLIPTSCAPIPVNDCSLIAAALQAGATGVPGVPKFDSATCVGVNDACDCDVSVSITEQRSDTYTATDGVITTEDPTRTFEYCAEEGRTTYLETTPPDTNAFQFPVIVEMTK